MATKTSDVFFKDFQAAQSANSSQRSSGSSKASSSKASSSRAGRKKDDEEEQRQSAQQNAPSYREYEDFMNQRRLDTYNQVGREQEQQKQQGAVQQQTQQDFFTREANKEIGKYGKGNINLYDRDTNLYDETGKLKTVNSISFKDDENGPEILIPTVVKKDGKWVQLSDDEAKDWYHKTGEYLGKFNTREEADDYANRLHEQQAERYGTNPAAEAFEEKSGLGKAWDVAKGIDTGAGNQFLSALSGVGAAIGGRDTVIDDAITAGRAIFNRDDGISARQALRSLDDITAARIDEAFSGAGEIIRDKAAGIFNRLGANMDTENDWMSQKHQEKANALEEERKRFRDVLGEAKNPIANFNDLRKAVVQEQAVQKQAKYANSPIAATIDKYGTMAGASLPTMAVATAMALAGHPEGSVAMLQGGVAEGTTAGLAYISAINNSSKMTQLGMMVTQSLGNLTNNPTFWVSYGTEMGNAYNTAIDEGADQTTASLYASVYGAFSALVELGGGDDALGGLEKTTPGLMAMLRSGDLWGAAKLFVGNIASEIGEEEIQGMLESGLKSSYSDVPIYSDDKRTLTSDFKLIDTPEGQAADNAIVNPRQMLETAKDTAITTAILGAGQQAVAGTATALAGKQQAREGTTEQTEAPSTTEPEQAAEPEKPGVEDTLLNPRGENGRLSNSQVNEILKDPDAYQEFLKATGLTDAEVKGSTNSETRKNVKDAAAQFLAEAAEGPAIPKNTRAADLKQGSGKVSYDGATVDGVEYAAVDVASLTNKQKQQINAMESVAKATGVNVVFFQSKQNEKGQYVGANGFYKDGTVYLDVNAGLESKTEDGRTVGEIAMVRTASHELTHFIQQFNEEQYDQIKNYVTDALVKQTGAEGLEDLIEQKMKRDSSGQLTREAALDEVIADGCEMMLKDSKAIERLATENQSLATKIRDWIRNWVKSIHAAFKGIDATHTEAKILMREADKLQQMWDSALETASKNSKKEGAVREGNTQYMARDEHGNVVVDQDVTPKTVKSTFQSILDGKNKGAGFTFPVMKKTPQVYRDYAHMDGSSSLVMWSKKAYQSMVDHGMGVDGMMQVLDQMHTPAYIVYQTYGQNAGHYAAVLENEKGETLAIVDLGDYRSGANAVNGESGYYDVLVTTFKPDSDYLENNIFDERNDIVYDRDTDQKYEAPEHVASGVTPSGLAAGASSTDNIAQNKTESNTNIQKSERENQSWPEGTVYNRRAIVSEETMDKWLQDYAASNPNYAQAYITYMKPFDFLQMTTSGPASRANIREQAKGLDVGKTVEYSKDQPIHLTIDSKTGQVIGHEGRHRMVSLYDTGIERVPVLLFDSKNKYDKTAMDSLKLYQQEFTSNPLAPATAVVSDVQPLSRGNIDAVREKFGKMTSLERMSEKYQGTKTVQFSDRETAEEKTIDVGDSAVNIDTKTESAAPQYSLRTWNESDYVTERDKAADELATAIGVSKKKAQDYIDSVNSVAKMIADSKGKLDYTETGLSPFVSNSEYGGSFDFTTLCKKRRLLTGTFSAIQKALKNTALTANEILEIRKMMDDAGLEVSCGKCYVEGSRASMGIFTKEFINLYKKYNPGKWAPNMAEMNTPDGIEWVRQTHPEVYEQYEYFWNHYGTLRPGDPNLFASQQKPKLYQMRSAYSGEILKHFKKGESVAEKNKNGGVRLQSFSDFEIVHLIDAMQVITDMARVGLNGQAYTKVPEFAWALGKTGLKINLSIDAWSVGEDGKLIFNNKEGMNFDTAMEIRNANSENVGTICCVYDDAQLLAALADDRIDFIIPFHRSQWKKSQYKGMGLPATTKDYTYQQNEKWLDPSKHTHEYRGRQVKDKCTNYMPNEYWDFTKSGKENAENYLRKCAEDGKRPKFYKFLDKNDDGSFSLKKDGSTDGYWKLLIDFKMYDNEGNGVPQSPVRPEFNMDGDHGIQQMLTNYEGGHEQFPVAHGIVDEFVDRYKAKHPNQTQFQLRENGTGSLPANWTEQNKKTPNPFFEEDYQGSAQNTSGAQTSAGGVNIPPSKTNAAEGGLNSPKTNAKNKGVELNWNDRSGEPTKTSQFYTGTLTKTGEAKYLNETDFKYVPISEQESMKRAAKKIAEHPDEVLRDLYGSRTWTSEQMDAAYIIRDKLMSEAMATGNEDSWSAYERFADFVGDHKTEAGAALQAIAKQSRPGASSVLEAARAEIAAIRKAKAESGNTKGQVSEQVLTRAEEKTRELATRLAKVEYEIDQKIESGTDEKTARESAKDDYLDLVDEINTFRHTGLFQDAKKYENARAGKQIKELNTKFRKMLARQDMEYIQRYTACAMAGIAADTQYEGQKDTLKRLNTFQKLAQLTGTGTWTRNLWGNVSFGLVDALSSNLPITVLTDVLVSKKTGQRASAVEKGVVSKEVRYAARMALERSILEVAGNIDLDQNQTKYDMSQTRAYDPGGERTLERLTSRWEQWNGYMLQSSDAWFKGAAESSVRDALIRANHWDENNLTTQQKKQLDEAAKQVAEYRTFQNDSTASRAADKLRDGLNKLFNPKWKPGQFGVGTALMPYTKVPTNIGVKAVEFSPVGALNGLREIAKVVRDPNATLAQQNKAVTDFGRGVTGTALIIGLATIMKNAPWFRDWENEDDKDVKAQNKAEGKSGTQINIDMFLRALDGDEDPTWQNEDRTVDISSMEPLNQLLTIASLYAEGDTLQQAYWTGAIDSIRGLPSVQTLSNIEDTIRYTDTPDDFAKTFWTTLGSTAGNVAGGFIPAPIKHATTASDEFARDTSGNTAVERAVNQAKSGLPGFRQTLPIKTDAFGNEVRQGDARTRIKNQYGAFKYNQVNQSDVSRELERIREATDEVLVPSKNGPNSVTYGSGKDKETVKLTAEEKRDYKNALGKDYEKSVQQVMADPVYQLADDDTKAAMLRQVEKFSKDTAKLNLAEDRGIQHESEFAKERELDDPIAFLTARTGFNTAKGEDNWRAVDTLLQTVREGRLSEAEQDFYEEHMQGFKRLYAMSGSGVGSKRVTEFADALKDLYESEKRVAARGSDYIRIAGSGKFTDKEADVFMSYAPEVSQNTIDRYKEQVQYQLTQAGMSESYDAVWNGIEQVVNGELDSASFKKWVDKNVPIEQRQEIKDICSNYNKDRTESGKTVSGIYKAMRDTGYTAEQALQFFEMIDTNYNGYYTKKEFDQACAKAFGKNWKNTEYGKQVRALIKEYVGK